MGVLAIGRKRLLIVAVVLLCLFSIPSVFGEHGGPPKADLDQAHNGSAASPDSPVDWVNGNANENNSHYIEGYSIPYRLIFSNLSVGEHTVIIEWDIKHSGAHAIDYITSYDRLEPHAPFGHGAEGINPIEGTTATGTPDTFPIPVPSSTGSPVPDQPTTDFNTLQDSERQMTLWNGTITDMEYVAEGDLNEENSSTRMSIAFTVTEPHDDAVLAWGGHIGTAEVWGDGNSAGGISGSPYHTRLISLDGVGGNQDRSLSAAAVIPAPQGSITLDKVTVPSADAQSFGFTTSGLPAPTSPSLTDAATPIVWSALEDGTYTITENVPGDWDLTSKNCTGATQGTTITPTASGLNISLANGDQLVCTFTNTKRAHIIVDKVTQPSGDQQSFGFTTTGAGYTGFSLTDSAASNNQSVVPGNYTVAETAVDGWTQVSATCDGQQSPNSITVTAGQTVTCTFTNSKLPRLTLVKTVTNDNGGTSLPGAWTLTATGPTPLSGVTGTAAVTNAAVSAGEYNLGETGEPAGYTAGTYSCANNSGNPVVSNTITLAPGDNATCTINNNDNAPGLTLVKVVTNDNGGGATENQWTLTATGPTGFSGAGPSVSNGASFDTGSYDLSESGPSSYTASSWVCVGGTQDDSDTVRVSLGQSAICTITNNDNAPSLTLVKVVVNDNGGTALENAWTLTATGPAGFSGAGPSVPNGTSFDAGSYDLSETGPAGYTASDWVCVGGTQNDGDTVTVGLGQSATCTITNNDNVPTLILNKVVVNDNGGSATESQWTLNALAGPTPFSGPGAVGDTDVTSNAAFDAGTYSLTETGGPAGYTASAWTCVGGNQNGANITVGLGQTATCTITNNDQQASITVVKVVTNDNGGSALPNDFNLTLESNPVTSGITVPVNPGTYTAGETNLPGYTFEGFSGDCDQNGDTTVALGETKTCTLTNNDRQAFLIVNKTVINDNGGTAGPNDFLLTVDNTSVLDEVAVPVNPGVHTAGETLLTGYTAGPWGGDCNVNASVTVALGETKTCTITNNDTTGTLTIVKNTVGGDGQFNFTVTGPTASTPSITTAAGTGSNGPTNVNAGTYSVAETIPDGWTLNSGTCNDGTSVFDVATVANIQVSLGENVICTFTNTKRPKLTVVKVTVPADDDGNFNLLINGTEHATDVGDGGTTGAQFAVIGANTFAEAAGTNTNLADYTSVVSGDGCGGTATAGTITLAAGDDKTCTITNTRKGRIIVNKVTDPAGDPQSFDFTAGGTGYNNFSLTDAAAPNNQQVVPGLYTVTETVPAGWDQTSATCDSDEAPGSIDVGPGETVTCTFTNQKDANIVVIKQTIPAGDLTLFTFVANYDNDGFSLSDGQSNDSGDLNPGAYSVSETVPVGWVLDSATCSNQQNPGSLTLAAGQTITCTFTNGRLPKLTLVKNVTNNNGGTLGVSDFPLFVDAQSVTSGQANTFAPGNYTASETNHPDYTASVWGGACAATGTVTLAFGDDKTCTITNNDTAPQLHLRKVIVNDNGGAATVADFTLTANGTGSNDLSGTSPVDSGPGLIADTFALSETGPAGYTASAWVCVGGTQNGANITVGINQSATCTITNNDIAPRLIVIKTVINDNGGTRVAGDFTMLVTATEPSDDNFPGNAAGTTITLDVGAYSVDEQDALGYIKTLGTDCVGTIAIGETKTCTITNNDPVPPITRTIGFWQTHLALATQVFEANQQNNYWFICGPRTIETIGELEGGLWANVAKTTTNAKRSKLNQARMQMMQQLLGAMLNKAAFETDDGDLIAAAKTAYCTEDTAQILSLAGQLDTFNNSGDDTPLPTGVNTASATPKTAKDVATEEAWDTLP
ncbi:MAG: hypothetical protein V4702_03230 [Patescibacteria group bacterium]